MGWLTCVDWQRERRILEWLNHDAAREIAEVTAIRLGRRIRTQLSRNGSEILPLIDDPLAGFLCGRFRRYEDVVRVYFLAVRRRLRFKRLARLLPRECGQNNQPLVIAQAHVRVFLPLLEEIAEGAVEVARACSFVGVCVGTGVSVGGEVAVGGVFGVGVSAEAVAVCVAPDWKVEVAPAAIATEVCVA